MTTKKRALRPRAAKKVGRMPAAKAPTVPRKPRKGQSNGTVVMELLSRPEGVSLAELMKKLKVQKHTARSYVSVESRKHGKKAVLAEGRYRID